MIEGKFMEQSPIKQLAKIRTDVVGSLLRPAHLKQAYLQRDQGKIGEDELRRIGRYSDGHSRMGSGCHPATLRLTGSGSLTLAERPSATGS